MKLDDEWVPENEESEEEIDIDEAKKELFEKINNVKHTLSGNLNVDILKSNLKYMKNDIKLKNYQVDGVNWIINLYKNNFNGILADDMGLGKTIQTICALAYIKQYENKKSLPSIIVIPLSIYNNWIEEVERFSKLTIYKFRGYREERGEMKKYLTQHGFKEDICLVTYETALIESEFLSKFKYDFLIVDEAHRIKNKKTILYEKLNEYKFNHSLFLTGTPIQNNIGELHSLLQFLNPKIFNMSEKVFSAFFPSLSDMVELQSIIKPFILRREKEKVLKLPPINETIIYTELSELQKRLYKAILIKDFSAFKNKKNTRLLNLYMQLKKCVNHPYLFDEVEPEPYEMGEHLIQASGKFVILEGLLKYIKNNNHKVLIFSQMTRVLDIIQDYLDYMDYSYERLDGSVKSEDRYKAIKNFMDDKKDVFIFLLSTRAGGLGLNLTAADTVIFVDSDFNPQADRQAAARVYRIGQTKRIQVIRLLCKDSIEEAIWNHINEKLEVSESIMKKGAFSNTKDFRMNDNIEEETKKAKKEFKKPEILVQILKHGLKNILQSENEEEEKKGKKKSFHMSKQEILQYKMKFLISDDDLDKIFHAKRGETKVGNEKGKEKEEEEDDDDDDVDDDDDDDVDDDDEVRINSTIPAHQIKKKNKSKIQIDTISIFNYKLQNNTIENQRKSIKEDEEAFNNLITSSKEPKDKEEIEEDILNNISISHKRRLRSEDNEDDDENILSLDEIEKIGRQKRSKLKTINIEKRRNALHKKWQENNYKSFNLLYDESLTNSTPSSPSNSDLHFLDDNDTDNDLLMSDSNTEQSQDHHSSHHHRTIFDIHFINGNVVYPSISDIKKYGQSDINNIYHTYIVHCVDKSGRWGYGGVFSAINEVDRLVGHRYEFAGENEDLRLGDVHLIPVRDDATDEYSENNIKRYIALFIAYNRDRHGRLMPLNFNKFESCLTLLSKKAMQTNASIHIPRISQGSNDFNWYGIERIIRKTVTYNKIPTFIYYYKKPSYSSEFSSPVLSPLNPFTPDPSSPNPSSPKPSSSNPPLLHRSSPNPSSPTPSSSNLTTTTTTHPSTTHTSSPTPSSSSNPTSTKNLYDPPSTTTFEDYKQFSSSYDYFWGKTSDDDDDDDDGKEVNRKRNRNQTQSHNQNHKRYRQKRIDHDGIVDTETEIVDTETEEEGKEDEEEEEEILDDDEMTESETDDTMDSDEMIKTTYHTRNREKRENNYNYNYNNNRGIESSDTEEEAIETEEEEEEDDDEYHDDDDHGHFPAKSPTRNNNNNNDFVIDIDSPKLISMALSQYKPHPYNKNDLSMKFEALKKEDKMEIEKEEEQEEEMSPEEWEQLKSIRQALEHPFPNILKGMTIHIYTTPVNAGAEDSRTRHLQEIMTRHILAYGGRTTRTIADPRLTHILLMNDQDRQMISVFNQNITIITLNDFIMYLTSKLD